MRLGLGNVPVEVSLRPPSEKCGMGIVGCTILEFRVEMRPLTESPGTLYTLLLKSCIEFYFFLNVISLFSFFNKVSFIYDKMYQSHV